MYSKLQVAGEQTIVNAEAFIAAATENNSNINVTEQDNMQKAKQQQNL